MPGLRPGSRLDRENLTHSSRSKAVKTPSGGIPRLTIAKILNHVERSVTAVYDRHGHDPEKRSALDWWDAKLIDILRNAQRGPARVLSINARA